MLLAVVAAVVVIADFVEQIFVFVDLLWCTVRHCETLACMAFQSDEKRETILDLLLARLFHLSERTEQSIEVNDPVGFSGYFIIRYPRP